MPDEPMQLRIEIGERDDDAEARDTATRALRDELLDLDVEDVRRPAEETPEGARAAEAVAAGTLLVALAPHAVTAVSATVQGWLSRRGGRTAALELDGDRIELTGASEDDQRRLIEAFLARHGVG